MSLNNAVQVYIRSVEIESGNLTACKCLIVLGCIRGADGVKGSSEAGGSRRIPEGWDDLFLTGAERDPTRLSGI